MTSRYKTQSNEPGMARPREFNEDEVIDRAVDLFWRKGFADTSIGDLEEALGMGRQSIYNTFGDKRSLYIRALQHYYEKGTSTISSFLNEGKRGLDSIHAYFNMVVEQHASPEGARGCFLVKSLVDHGTSDPEVVSRCRSNENRLVSMFKQALTEAVEDQTISATTNVGATALMLSTQLYGLSVMARSGMSGDAMRESTQTLLNQLGR